MNIFKFQKTDSRKLILNVFGIKISFRLPDFYSNKIILVKKNGKEIKLPFIFGIKTKFLGENATLKIYEPMPKFQNCKFIISENSVINIGESQDYIRNLNVSMYSPNSELIMGKNIGIVSCSILFNKKENCKVEIGDDCIIANNVTIRTCDGHTIKDINTNEIINEDKNVKIGNHVWLGQNSTILKDSVIPNNTIVACNAVVTKNFCEEHIILAGIPAKIVKNNVNWER